jgi:surface carbohydrate biosynthesis protein
MNTKVNILLPIETICRELDYKLVIATMLAKNDNTTIMLGHYDVIDNIIAKTYNGLYIGKSIFKQLFLGFSDSTNTRHYQQLKKQGYGLVYLDEEGGVYAGDSINWGKLLNQRIKAEILDQNDMITTWGEFQKNHYSQCVKSNEMPPAILNTGHPRFDMAKPKYHSLYMNEVKQLSQQYGDYIIINTNLTLANNIMGVKDTFSSRFGYVTDDNKRINYIEQWAHTTKILSGFVELVQKLACEFPDINFIVRAHPSEDPDFYKAAFNQIENIIINSEGSVIPWLVGAKAMIHDGCTTAIEAYLAHTPVINYKSITNKQHDLKLPNKIGIQCISIKEVVRAIKKISGNTNDFQKINQFDEEDYSLLSNLKTDVVNGFIDLMNIEINKRSQLTIKSPNFLSMIIRERLHSAKTKIKDVIRKALFHHKHQMSLKYSRKFPGFCKEELRLKLNSIENIIGYKVNIKYISKRLIVINKKTK